MKKKLTLNILALTSVATCFVTSCVKIGTATGNMNAYAEKIMKKTEFISKLLLFNRSENINVGTNSEVQFLYLLPDSQYNKQLGIKRDELTEVNGNFNSDNILGSSKISISETSPTAMLSGFAGNNEEQNVFSKSIFDRYLDMDSSSVFNYEMDSGPMKTYFKSNMLINKKSDTDSIFNNGSYLQSAFSYNTEKYFSLSNGQIANINKNNMKVFSYDNDKSLIFYDTSSDGQKNTYEVGENEINSANSYNFFKQMLGLNEISKSLPLVSDKNNINNLYLFLNNMFALDSTSNPKVFGNLGGTIFSKLYAGQGVFLNQGIKSLIFDNLFDKNSYYNADFVNKRNNLVKGSWGSDRLSIWFNGFFKIYNQKAWINGRDLESSERYFDTPVNTLKDKNGGKINDTLNDILNDLNNTYIDYFNWIDKQENSKQMYQDLNDELYKQIKKAEGTIGTFVGQSWSKLIDNISQKIMTSSNPYGTLSAKSFILGLLSIFMLCNNNNSAFQNAKNNFNTGLNTVGDIYKLDMSKEENKLKVYESLGYQNGYIVKGSIFDNLYSMFNDKTNVAYNLMHSLFLDDDSAIKKVFIEDYDSIMNTEMNGLFDKPTMGIDVNWSFSNPVYDNVSKTVTYDVSYDGPGDTSFNYSLHEEPLVSKDEQIKFIKVNKLHSSNNDGIWDYVLQKLDSDPNKYNMQWFLGYDGGWSNEYKKTQNNYKITFKNISSNSEKQTWALVNLKWFHYGKQYFDIFE